MEQFGHNEPLPEEIEEVVILADEAFEHLKESSYFDLARQNIEEQDPMYKEFFEVGDIEIWVRARLSEGVSSETITQIVHKFFLDVLTEVMIQEGEGGSSGDYGDETDGWLPPPQWRG